MLSTKKNTQKYVKYALNNNICSTIEKSWKYNFRALALRANYVSWLAIPNLGVMQSIYVDQILVYCQKGLKMYYEMPHTLFIQQLKKGLQVGTALLYSGYRVGSL